MKQVGARHDIIREWRSLPKELRQTDEQVEAFAMQIKDKYKFSTDSADPYQTVRGTGSDSCGRRGRTSLATFGGGRDRRVGFEPSGNIDRSICIESAIEVLGDVADVRRREHVVQLPEGEIGRASCRERV